MARTIDYLTFMVDVTPYEHEGHNYDALNIIVAYRKGQGFVITWQPVKREPMGYMTGPMPSRDILVSGVGFVVKEASRNNAKVLEQMRTNLEVAKEGVKFYFDQRDFDALKTFMGDVANYGYTADLENKINELINNSKSSTVMTTNNKTNESANVQNAQVSNPANESPMMKQFKQLKEKNPNALLLFRCGDFYECYEDDAKAVAEVCGITLTKAADTTMAGFPHHNLSNYLPKLIRAGKRVAMCDQLEKPKPTAKSEEEKPKAETKAEEPKAEKPKTTKPKTTKPKSEKPKDKAKANDEKPKLIYETYTSKKGKTCARIKGFSEDDTFYQNAELIHASKTWERDKKGNKTFMLVFGPVYAAAAKQLCDAINSGKKEDVAPALVAIENALTTHRKEREEKRAEYKAKKAANTTTKSEGCYTKEDVAAMLNDLLAGKDIPEDIKRLLPKAA